MSGRVDSAIFESGIVENVGVAVDMASLAISVRSLFPLPVSTSGSVADILDFRCPPRSGGVGSAISESDRYLVFRMSDTVGGAISRSGMVENIGVAVEVSFVVVTQA